MQINRTSRFALFHILVAVVLTTLLPDRYAFAQSVLNPNTAEFSPSADHNTLLTDGSPAVQSYQLELYLTGATTPFQVVSLGKPAPQADGKIRVALATVLNPLPQPGVSYFADVTAVGPGGISKSTASNPFSWGVPCTYGVTPLSPSVGAAASTNNILTVTAGTSCTWTAVSNASWITVTAGASGAGNGSVTYSAAANTSTSPRSGSLTVAGQTINVTQAGACGFTLTPTTQTVGAAASTNNSITVTTGGACGWTAASNTSWITVTSGAAGTGAGSVKFSVAANTSTISRNGSLTVAGQTFNVTQSGVACSFTIAPTTQTVGADGGPSTASVTANGSTCQWTASTGTSWITITNGTSGTGSGTVSYAVAANTTQSSRSGSLTIAGQTLTVSQDVATPPAPPTNVRVVTN
jgi:hypothetical protein